MSTPYPPPPRRLVRSTSNRVVGGVCGGVAQYLNMDANLVRILTVLVSLFTGVPVILYVVALFVMPEDTSAPSAPPPVTGASTYSGSFSAPESTTPAPAYTPYPSVAPRPAAEDAVWGSEGPPWEQRQPEPTPAAAPAASAPLTEPAPTTGPAATAGSAQGSTPEPVAPAEPQAPGDDKPVDGSPRS